VEAFSFRLGSKTCRRSIGDQGTENLSGLQRCENSDGPGNEDYGWGQIVSRLLAKVISNAGSGTREMRDSVTALASALA
jgi:hypothetical protein